MVLNNHASASAQASMRPGQTLKLTAAYVVLFALSLGVLAACGPQASRGYVSWHSANHEWQCVQMGTEFTNVRAMSMS
jgi:hypothetical protein